MIVQPIEIFRTTIQTHQAAAAVIQLLQHEFPATRITIDLEDCDRVLRIAGDAIDPNTIMKVVKNAGFGCEFLE